MHVLYSRRENHTHTHVYLELIIKAQHLFAFLDTWKVLNFLSNLMSFDLSKASTTKLQV